jgi:mRNA interferase MazF
MGMVRRFEVYLTNLDPTVGVEIQKRRPCLIVSPDEMNTSVRTVIIAPMTTKTHSFPSRVACVFEGKSGFIILDQIRAIDKSRLGKRLDEISDQTKAEVLENLQEIFEP